MSYYGGTVTVAGRNLITSLMAGKTIEFTRIMVGSGAMPEGVEPIDMVALVAPVAEGVSSVPTVENGVLSMVVEYRNDLNGGLQEGFWLREFGVFAKTEDTEENFAAEIASWQTKRERGADYVMGTGTWEEQMDKFEETFVGMTVDEVEDWFEKYCSDLNGRPLKDGSDKEEDKAKYDALTEEEKAMLADVTSTATMSLQDSHGDILAAIRDSLNNQVAIELTVE